MTRQQYSTVIALGIVAMVLAFGVQGCMPARPKNVPSDAVYVVGAKGGWWQYCAFDQKRNVDLCQIFNMGGDVVSDEVFLPYDGGKTAGEDELKIVSNSKLAGPQFVCLKNGRILIPETSFEQQKRFLDWATGKSKIR